MAPFIPQGLINPDLNLFFALVIGIGFGYILEQAGFSSSRKLAGVFYGYDFVVLRVFFTAGITAMTGLVLFSYLGWVDMSLVYINPTFLWSAILGGVLMGFGFIMGGFCPGTSVVGAVIGKVDAMMFLAGSFIGIFVFGHFYEAFLRVYNGANLGSPLIYDTLGLSKSWFAFILVFVALSAFAVTQLIEDKINGVLPDALVRRPNYKLPAFLILGLVFLNLFLPEQKHSGFSEVRASRLLEKALSDEKYISVEETTYHLMNGNRNLILIDTRSAEDFNHFSLPGAVNIPAEEILNREWRSFLAKDPRRKVFFSSGESMATKAWLSSTRAGYSNVFILEGGINNIFTQVFMPGEPVDYNNDVRKEFNQRFMEKARAYFRESEKGIENKQQEPLIPQKTVEVQAASGGC